MEKATLNATDREELRKNKVKKLRAQGLVPAVIYGNKKENQHIYLDRIEFEKALRTDFVKNTVLKLNISKEKDKSTDNVITYNIQRDVITNFITHIDFLRVDKNTKIKLDIPLKFEGVAPGTKRGGILIKKMEYVTISVLPENIPANIVIDLSNLNTNEFIAVKDIEVNGFTVLSNLDDSIVRVAAPKEEVEEAEMTAEDEDAEESDEESKEESEKSEASTEDKQEEKTD